MKKKVSAMHRRSFLKLGAIGGLTAIIGGGVLAPNFRRAIQAILQAIHPTLEVSKEVSDAFFDEATALQLWDRLQIGRKEQWILMTYATVPPVSYLPYAEHYGRIKQRIVKAFLPATTFFQNRMDTTQPLQYVGLYNPFVKPCGNPFSALYYPDLSS